LEIAALASLRRAYVSVHRKPMVAILSTGSELADFHEPPSAHRAMCSNPYSLAAQVMEAGAMPLCLGIVKDDLNAQQAVLNEALRADVVITSGGTSKGKYDLVHKVFSSMGMKIRFSNIFSKPGKPSIFGTIGRCLIFGLPGNPSATMLSFEQFIKPALLKMMGHGNVLDSATPDEYEKKKVNAFSQIDAFNEAHGGNKNHRRASHIPLIRPLAEKNDDFQPKYSASDSCKGQVKTQCR
jgi:molybdopterin molybdotransferase